MVACDQAVGQELPDAIRNSGISPVNRLHFNA